MNCRMFLTPLCVGSFIILVSPTDCPSAISTNELVQLMDKKDWTTSRFVAELVADRSAEAIPPLIDMLQLGSCRCFLDTRTRQCNIKWVSR